MVAIVAAVALYAAAPDAMTSTNPYCDKWLNSSDTYYSHSDTLVDADSLWLMKGIVPETGREYEVIFPLINGNGSDSTYIYVYIDCYDGTTKIERALIDSITTAPTVAAPKKVFIPFHQTLKGTKFDLLLKTHATDNGGEVVLNNTVGFKCRLITFQNGVTVN